MNNEDLKGRLLGSRVLVEPFKQEEKTGGVILPGKSEEPTYTGTVIMVGDGAILNDGTKVPMNIHTGETVYFQKFVGFDLELENGKSYLVINERDIIYARPADE